VDGKQYAVIEAQSNSSASKALIREQDGNIYTRQGEFGFAEVLYVKTNAGIGEQWNFTITVNNMETLYEYTMVAKGITKTVNGREYQNVLQTHVTLYAMFNEQKIP